MGFYFPKSEKLKSSKTIERLFEEGKTYTSFPVKVIYLPRANEKSTQAAFAVPKRNFKTAVSRNRIKRQLREVYRLHKQFLIATKPDKFVLLFLYIGKEKPLFSELEYALKTLIKKIRDEAT